MKVVFIVASLVLSVFGTTFYDPINYYENCAVLNTEEAALMVLFWTIEGEYLNATVAGRTLGWVGWGINVDNQPAMVHSDVVWGYVNEQTNETFVADFNNGQKTVCNAGVGVCDDTQLTNGIDNIVSYSAWQDDSLSATFLQFVRPLAAGDQYDATISDTDQYFIYAMASFDSLGKHDIVNDVVSMNLFSTPACGDCPQGTNCIKGCCVPDPNYTTSTTMVVTTGTTGDIITGPATTGDKVSTTGNSSASSVGASMFAIIAAFFVVLF